MADDKLIWLIGALVCFVIVITAVIPTAISSASNFNAPNTATGELWDGTASVAHAMVYRPITGITNFKNASVTTSYNDTALTGGNGVRNVLIDAYAAVDASAWNAINITFTTQGVNSTTNITWVGGTCSPGGLNTTFNNGNYTLSDADSDCLTPGANVLFTFVNTTKAGEAAGNITNVSISYFRYRDSTDYTLSNPEAGEITPTRTGHYYTTYAYGTAVTGASLAVVVLLPLMIALVLLMLFLKSSGMF